MPQSNQSTEKNSTTTDLDLDFEAMTNNQWVNDMKQRNHTKQVQGENPTNVSSKYDKHVVKS